MHTYTCIRIHIYIIYIWLHTWIYMVHLSGCSFLASPGFGDQLIALAFEPQPQGTQHPEQCPKGSRLRTQGRGPSWNQLTLQFRVHQGLGERYWKMVDKLDVDGCSWLKQEQYQPREASESKKVWRSERTFLILGKLNCFAMLLCNPITWAPSQLLLREVEEVLRQGFITWGRRSNI